MNSQEGSPALPEYIQELNECSKKVYSVLNSYINKGITTDQILSNQYFLNTFLVYFAFMETYAPIQAEFSELLDTIHAQRLDSSFLWKVPGIESAAIDRIAIILAIDAANETSSSEEQYNFLGVLSKMLDAKYDENTLKAQAISRIERARTDPDDPLSDILADI